MYLLLKEIFFYPVDKNLSSNVETPGLSQFLSVGGVCYNSSNFSIRFVILYYKEHFTSSVALSFSLVFFVCLPVVSSMTCFQKKMRQDRICFIFFTHSSLSFSEKS